MCIFENQFDFFEIVWGGAGHDCLTLLWGLWPDNEICNHYIKVTMGSKVFSLTTSSTRSNGGAGAPNMGGAGMPCLGGAGAPASGGVRAPA